MPALRWHRAAVTGTLPSTTKLRWHRSAMGATALPTVAPIPPRAGVEPGETVTVTAQPGPGSAAPSSWTWRQVAGPPVTLVGVGASRTFEAPSVLTGGTVVLGVTATLDGTTGPEQTVFFTVAPQLSWVRAAGVAGGAWVGSKVVIVRVG